MPEKDDLDDNFWTAVEEALEIEKTSDLSLDDSIKMEFERIVMAREENIDTEILKFFESTIPRHAIKIFIPDQLAILFLRELKESLIAELNLTNKISYENNWHAILFLQKDSIMITGTFHGILYKQAIYRLDVIDQLKNEPLEAWSPYFISGAESRFMEYLSTPTDRINELIWNINFNLKDALSSHKKTLEEEIQAFDNNINALDIAPIQQEMTDEERMRHYTNLEMFATMQAHIADLNEKLQELNYFLEEWESHKILLT
ncbi:MAG: hypothetical protein ACXQS8_03600 [Candidatus Helarchaeales archaeon]